MLLYTQTNLLIDAYLHWWYQCSPPLSTLICTLSQTCLSMLASTKYSEQEVLPRNQPPPCYRNRPKSITFSFIPSSTSCFCQRLHIPPPLCASTFTYTTPSLCTITQSKKRGKIAPTQLQKRLPKCVSLRFAFHFIRRLDRSLRVMPWS